MCESTTFADFRRRLSAEERVLVDLRAQGCEWIQIAAKLRGTSQAICSRGRSRRRAARGELDR
jgi:hypothetical protein